MFESILDYEEVRVNGKSAGQECPAQTYRYHRVVCWWSHTFLLEGCEAKLG